jgi:hypothetical protein
MNSRESKEKKKELHFSERDSQRKSLCFFFFFLQCDGVREDCKASPIQVAGRSCGFYNSLSFCKKKSLQIKSFCFFHSSKALCCVFVVERVKESGGCSGCGFVFFVVFRA